VKDVRTRWRAFDLELTQMVDGIRQILKLLAVPRDDTGLGEVKYEPMAESDGWIGPMVPY